MGLKVAQMILSLFLATILSCSHSNNVVYAALLATVETITYSGFEAGTLYPYVADGSETKLESRLNRSCVGRYSVRIVRKSGFHHSMDIPCSASYSDFRLSFSYYPRGVQSNDAFVVQYSSDGGNQWKNIKRLLMANEHSASWNYQCHQVSLWFSDVVFDEDLSAIQNIRLRFQADTSDKRREFYIDDIKLEGLVSSPTPSIPSAPSSSPSISLGPTRSDVPSGFPSTVPPTATGFYDREDVCPITKKYPPEKVEILPYPDASGLTYVEDDLSEISSLAFASFTDTEGRSCFSGKLFSPVSCCFHSFTSFYTHSTLLLGNKYAYVASDKNQFSLKVIKIQQQITPLEVVSGVAETVAVYNLTNINFTNDDWEDISLGPCSDQSGGGMVCIYIGK
jgi:hypothetical protein